jgi:class 3 adenylate cyclase/tetratricopeptide (TPR) repeat protein
MLRGYAKRRKCGYKMNSCIACSARILPSHRFCPHCGLSCQPIAGTQKFRQTQTTKVSKRIKAAPERKEISVLFVDLCDSTASISQADPEEARAYLDHALGLMTAAVDAFGGTVSQLLGDGLLALFGAPLAQEDHALRACLASLSMLDQASKRPRSDQTSKLRFRIGIHSGEVIVGLTGEQLWSLYRADGTAIHIASRLEKLAKPESILISSATQRLIAQELDTQSIGIQTLRGVDVPIELFELVVGAQRSSAAPLARRQRWAPIVGRNELMLVLDTFAHAATAGGMRVIGLRGEAGVGKSRLLLEWQASQAVAGFSKCTTHAKGYFSATAYGLIADLVRSLIGTFSDPLALIPQNPLDVVESLPNCNHKHIEVVNELLGIGVLEEAWNSLSPNTRRNRIAETVNWLILQRVQSGPLLLVLEDIFLADRESQRVFEIIVPRLVGKNVLICMSYRQDFAHRWTDETWFIEHWVAPLPQAYMQALVHAMLGQHESLAAVVSTLVERADGNPFYLEQLAISLIDDGTLVGIPGQYRATQNAVDFRVPGSIASVIGARVDRLPAATKAVLEAAAVLRDPITDALIAAMTEHEVTQAIHMLGLGVAAGLLNTPMVSAESSGKQVFTFRHALVQEVIGASLTRPRRRELHRKAFFVLRDHFGEKNAEISSTLTHHAFLGEEWDQAATFAVKAMSRAVFRSANREALRLFDMGLDAAKKINNQVLAWSLEIGLLLEAIGALMALGQIDAILANLERANSIAEKLNDQRCQATVALQTSIFLWMRGKYTQGLGFAAQAMKAGHLAERRNLQMAACQSRVMHLHGLGQYRQALAETVQGLSDYAIELRPHRLMPGWATAPIINLRSFHASALWRLGDYGSAQEICNLAYSVLQDLDHPYSRGLIDFVQSQIWIEQGQYNQAEELMRASVNECITHDIPTLLPCSTAMLGGTLARSGRAQEAAALLQQGINKKIYEAGGTYGEIFMRLKLSVALRYEGQFGRAIDIGLQAVELAINGEQHGHSVEALFELALAYQCSGDLNNAFATLNRALQQAQQCDMPYYKTQIHETLENLSSGVTL